MIEDKTLKRGLKVTDDEWTDEEFARFTARMKAFKEDPKSLSPEVFEKCKALHAEIKTDGALATEILKEGGNLGPLAGENSKRAALADWLAKTP